MLSVKCYLKAKARKIRKSTLLTEIKPALSHFILPYVLY